MNHTTHLGNERNEYLLKVTTFCLSLSSFIRFLTFFPWTSKLWTKLRPKKSHLGIHVSETSSEGGYIFSQFVCGIFCFKIAAHENWRHPFSIQKEAHIFHTCLEWMSLDASKKWDCLHLFPFESFTHGQNIEKKVFCG